MDFKYYSAYLALLNSVGKWESERDSSLSIICPFPPGFKQFPTLCSTSREGGEGGKRENPLSQSLECILF